MIKLYVPIKKDREIKLRCTQRLPDKEQRVPDISRPPKRAVPNKKKG